MSKPSLTQALHKALQEHAAARVASAPEGTYLGTGGEVRAVGEMAQEWEDLYRERMDLMWADVAAAVLEAG